MFSFLLARLHLERLSSQITLDAVRENLKKLPIEINETYDEIMERIEKEGEEKGRKEAEEAGDLNEEMKAMKMHD